MSYLIQQCVSVDCPASIRFVVGQSGLSTCKWCQAGTSYYAQRSHPVCYPHPEYPWPWQTDEERERRIRMPHNQAMFRVKKHTDGSNPSEIYKKWLR